jgi:hypothetical protein
VASNIDADDFYVVKNWCFYWFQFLMERASACSIANSVCTIAFFSASKGAPPILERILGAPLEESFFYRWGVKKTEKINIFTQRNIKEQWNF